MDQTSSTARLVESYVIVQVSPSYPESRACADLWSTQYNALLELASNRSNIYSPLWHGPPATALTPQGQLAALDTLNSAAGLGAPVLLSSSTTTTTHLSSSATSSSSPTVASTAPQSQNKTFGSGFSKVKMLLIVVLSIVVFLLLATSLLSLRRRHRRQSVSGATSTETRILVVPSRQSPNMPQPEHPVVSRPTSIWKTPESLVGEEIDISSVVEERGSIVFSEDVETGRPRTVDIMDPPYPSSMPRLIRQLKEMLARTPPENIDEPPPYRL
ncbi:hypothetical protein PHLCEN_2v9898 [Hermanssonia centrifuga]|uniref:Transmembrane protein n=1 Tax=Hermanssonia centrifuga TaxID=98765 RepID=A0A2R6NPN3_9APHY|nr:hypothetical protein PHLCEN_2v9898 [Hermanssonia centrifuga]